MAVTFGRYREFVGARVWAGARATLCPHVYKEVLPKKNPKNQKEQRTKKKTKRKAGAFSAVSSVGGTFSAVSSGGGTF